VSEIAIDDASTMAEQNPVHAFEVVPGALLSQEASEEEQPVAEQPAEQPLANWFGYDVLVKVLVGSCACNGILLLACIGFGYQLNAAAWAVLFAVPGAFVLAYANGANDCANSVGTAVGAGAMTMKQALISGSICEFIGALTIGPWVAKSIAGGELHVEKFNAQPELFSLVMLSALLGAGITTLLATVYGYPISATHGVISGLIAVGLGSGVDGAVNWPGFGFCVIGWVASPVAGLLAGALVSWCVHKLVIGAEDPAAAARSRQPILFGATATMVLLFLLMKGPKFIQVKPAWAALLIALLGGTLLGVALYLFGRMRPAPPPPELVGDGEDGLEDGPQFDSVQEPFVRLLIVAGLTVAFAHGGNDVGNSVGPLAVVIDIWMKGEIETTPALPMWCLLLGAGAFVVGILSLGSRTVSTVGSKITDLTPSRSFATQMGAAIAVLGSSVASLPVSTSHCLVGSVIGVSLAEQFNGIPDAKLDLSVLKKIVIGWVVTIPLAAAVATVVMLPLKSLFD